jgi:hypothetical protein
MRCVNCVVAVALACLYVSIASAQDAAILRTVEIVDAGGKTSRGRLAELTPGQLTLGTSAAVRIKTRDLVLLRFPDRVSRLTTSGPLVVLTGGDMLALQAETVDDEYLTGSWVRDPQLPALKVALEAVRGIVFDRPAHAASFARLLDLILDGQEPHDTVVLQNGDTLIGEFAGLNDRHLVLKTPAGTSQIERQGVRAVVLNPALSNNESVRGEGAFVRLTDGSRFRARDVKFVAPDQLSLRPQFGGQLKAPLDSVESLRFLGGCATYLSDLVPTDYKFEPFLDLDWPLRRDRSVAGGFLKLRGAEFGKGLGVHSRSTVTYQLGGKYKRLQATIGVDDAANGKGSAVFEVLLDGKVAYRSDLLTGASPAVPIPAVDLTGVKSLSLLVDYGTNGDILDHADWCDAVLVK